MKKLIIIITAAGIALSSCTGTDKTNRNSDTEAAKGNSGAADTTKVVKSSYAEGASATSPGTTDTSKIGDTAAGPTADTPVKKNIGH